MDMKEQIVALLSNIVHPEYKKGIVSLGMVEQVETKGDAVRVTLLLPRARDPFAASLQKAVRQKIESAFPASAGQVTVLMKEPSPKPRKEAETPLKKDHPGIRNVIAVASGKGGVGKSTVTANLAVSLAKMGYKVGVIDADIYGPSLPKMFGVEGHVPAGGQDEAGRDYMLPAEKYGVKLMSIGFFIKPTDALVWRGPMATNALRQLIHQTRWGELDFLLVDLPPGTGDVHLTVVGELKVTAAVIVSTPQQVALADVLRGIGMFRAESIEVPVAGLIENMAWFTPLELPDNRYYIFGKGGVKDLAAREGLPFLGEIPLVQGICESGDRGEPQALTNDVSARAFDEAARRLVDNLKTL